jgi:type II secretory pathway pseudopilin PulG
VPRGFSLLEVLFGTTILTVSVMSLAQLLAVSTRANASARTSASAALLAAQKIEQLRSLTWTFDASGERAGDTVPGGAIDRDVDGYVDWLDAGGRAAVQTNAAFVRRWSITPMSTDPDMLVFQVNVASAGFRRADAHIVAVKARRSR